MFKKKISHQVQTPSTYIVDADTIYSVDKNELVKKSVINTSADERLNLGRKIYKLLNYGTDKIIAIFESEGQIILKDKFIVSEDKSFENLSLIQTSPYNDKIFISVGEDIFNRDFGLYNIKEKRILWISKQVLEPKILADYFFSYANSEIRHHDLATSDTIWSLSIDDIGRYYSIGDKKSVEGEVKRFLGVYDKVLWVLLNNAVIVGIDIETGIVSHEIKEPVQSPSKFGKLEDKGYNFWYNYNNFLDEGRGKIMSLLYSGYSEEQFNCYYEIDLNTSHPQLFVSEIENTSDIPFKIDGTPCPIWPFDDDYIYVCNYRDYKLALFNRKTKQIDWVHQMEVDPAKKSFITKMEVHGNRWYVLDNSKTLYVYEQDA